MSASFKTRVYVIFALVSLILGVLAVRLYFIQVYGAYKYEATYNEQHTGSLGGIGYRGTIYDRNKVALTNDQEKYIYLVEKTKLDEECQRLLDTARADRITIDSRRYAAFESEVYETNVVNRLEKEFGGFVFSTVGQFSDAQPAVHLIGYLNRLDNSGAFGLERAFDKALYSDQSLYLVVDAAGRLLPGYGVERRGNNPGGKVMTTLDSNIQETVEAAFRNTAEKGSVAVVDVGTGGLLAGASFPAFNPNDVAEAIESGEDELMNKLLQSSYPPGSVFKIVVAAAAIENDIADMDTEFTCTGAETLYGIRIKCSKEEGHGRIKLKEAFAQSCNCAFIQLGQMVGDEKLLEMTEAFGVGDCVFDFLGEETEGVLPTLGDLQGAGIGNFSIGQGRLEMSCLQVARMTSVIANDGKIPNIHLVDIAADGNGEIMYENSQATGDVSRVIDSKSYSGNKSVYRDKNQIISPVTANKVAQLMKQTVLTGTGRRIEYDAAGKSGSAQSYQAGKKVVHGWFTGFFPSDDPKYVVTVFVENGGGAKPAITIFNDIAAALGCPEKPVPLTPEETAALFRNISGADSNDLYDRFAGAGADENADSDPENADTDAENGIGAPTNTGGSDSAVNSRENAVTSNSGLDLDPENNNPTEPNRTTSSGATQSNEKIKRSQAESDDNTTGRSGIYQ